MFHRTTDSQNGGRSDATGLSLWGRDIDRIAYSRCFRRIRSDAASWRDCERAGGRNAEQRSHGAPRFGVGPSSVGNCFRGGYESGFCDSFGRGSRCVYSSSCHSSRVRVTETGRSRVFECHGFRWAFRDRASAGRVRDERGDDRPCPARRWWRASRRFGRARCRDRWPFFSTRTWGRDRRPGFERRQGTIGWCARLCVS